MAAKSIAEQQEDSVFTWVSSQEAGVLESCFQALNIAVPAESKGKKRSLRASLLQHITKELEEAEDKEEVSPCLLLLSDYIGKLQAAKTPPTEVKEETTTQEGKSGDAGIVLDSALGNVSDSAVEKNLKLELEIARMQKEIAKGGLDVFKAKELKFTGVIGGGEKDKALSFTSLNYQIENARTAGYKPSQICAAVVKTISPSNYLRQFFEGRPSLKLDVLLGVLKSQFREGDCGTVFSELCTLVQEPGDDANKYVLKLLCLKQKILDLAMEEESTSYTEEMLRKQLFRTMYSGLRNNNIRVELRGKCGDKVEGISDEDLLAYVMEVTINETERNLKLGQTKKAGVNLVQYEESTGSKGNPKKDKENPFAKIEELKISNEQHIAALTALVQALQVQVEEVRQVLARHNTVQTDMSSPSYMPQGQGHRPVAPQTAPAPQVQANASGTPSLGQGRPPAPSFASRPPNFIAPPPNFTAPPPTFAAPPNFGGPAPNFVSPAPNLTPLAQNFVPQIAQTRNLAPRGNGKNNKCDNCRRDGSVRCVHCLLCYRADHKAAQCPLNN